MKVEGYDLEEMPIVEAINVGYVSLVAFYGEFPRQRGNYFSLDTADGKTYEIANMWYENLQHLIDEGTISFPIQIRVIQDKWAIVYDDRVPSNYYTDISYRAPQKFWSLTKQAQRQLDIDSGKITIHQVGGITIERHILPTPMTKLVKASYVPVYAEDVEHDEEFTSNVIDMIADPKYYTTINKSSESDEEDNEDEV